MRHQNVKEGILSGFSCIKPHSSFLSKNQEIRLKKLSQEVKKNEKTMVIWASYLLLVSPVVLQVLEVIKPLIHRTDY